MQTTEVTWPPALDAVIASANHHKLLFENEFVRVLEVRIPPGETTNIHTHQWPATVYTLGWSDFIRRDPEGNIMLEAKNSTPPASLTWWAQPIPPHTLQNSGDKEIHNICVEVKTR